ncbi:MAG: hypothetical protein Q8M09_09805 [Pseudomonadota bacterium]|nr:hypothetical protein [Pseudomonadota bacterium]MDP2351616.1 hypothetical protein [Pseudomonadota bacterium]
MSNPQDPRQAALQVLMQNGRGTPATTPAPVGNDGWEALVSHRPEPGAAVPMRKRLGPHTWVHATVWPGDSRYPWPNNFAPSQP